MELSRTIVFGDESISDSAKDVFSEVTETRSLVPKPPFALDTAIANAVGEFRFQPHERTYQFIQRILEIALPFSDATLKGI